MVVTFNFLDLPAEVREQIYRHYFQVDGGYTCRTIAREARHVPLSLNAIEFKTRYQPESNNLAGCFNLVSFTYQLLQSELTTLLAIASAMTPEIHDRLALEFLDFSQRLATALPSYEDEHEYYSENPVGDRRISRSRSPLADDPDPSVSHIRQLRSTLCYSTQDALAEKASILYLSSGYYRGFSRLSRPYYHNWCWYWSNSFWEAERAFSRIQPPNQQEIALCRAFKTINPEYPYARLTEPLYGSIQSAMIQEQEVDALGSLGNDNLSILRSDFNNGVEREFDTLINETSNHDASEWFHAWSVLLGNIDQPPHQVDYNTRLLENFEIRTD
ncbi:hypothetical protein HYE67_005176 [Fusarium culmorum]|uniref:Uncharacterized protein n=1 Tax=Fusarium culmorum TaxID=5516 RepID=A0A2T4GYA6_FUSCU|nr:hypothetical protein FCULG_00012509 [Fusarium culmorum]QPC62945.1 hypothetical protein HYE67_005176 [Fusarium culmorum]